MAPRWLSVFGVLCAVVAIAYADVTPQTLIITKPDNVQKNDEPSTAAELTTEAPLPSVKTMEMHVRADVTLRYSRTSVTTVVENPAIRSQETTFTVLLPETAFITGFTMILEGKSYEAYVKEKEEAKQIYNQAVSQGIAAAQVATKARDSNQFKVKMNLEKNSTATFNLTYEELLVRRNDVYNLAINLLAEELVPKLTVTVHIKEPQEISILRVPEISTGNEIIPTENYAENQKAEITRSQNGEEVTVVFKPDLVEQKRLREVYAQKTKDTEKQYSNLFGAYQSENNPPTPSTLGQFVVQYDVNRNKNANQVLVNDGYFVHFFAPSDLPHLNKHVVFVLDLSGSMSGRKIEQLREAIKTILGELNEKDYFSLVLFESSVTVQSLNATEPRPQYSYFYGQPEVLPNLLPPYSATPENIAKAKDIVSKLDANGGTNIASALDIAVTLVQKGITNETTFPGLGSNNTSSDVDEKNNNENEPEPIIIFLTDGEPTVGETDPRRIINSVTEKNYGRRKASIFSLGFGDYADLDFLRKLSLRNNGFSRHIYEGADANIQLHYFYKQISSPLLSHVNFMYPLNQVKQDSLTKKTFRTFYAGSEFIVAGRLTDRSDSGFLPAVQGFCGTTEGIGRLPYENIPIVIIKHMKEKKEYFPLERLWAYLTIQQLLDENDAAKELDKPRKEKSASEKKALELALKYSFVTKLTSLVVVKPNATDAVNAESVDKGVGAGAGGFSAPSYASVPLSGPQASFGSFGPAAASGFGGAYGPPALAFLPGLPAPPRAPLANAKPGGLFHPAGPYPGHPGAPGFPGQPGAPAFPGQSGLYTLSPPVITTPQNLPTVPFYTIESPNPLASYQLEHFMWIKPLLNTSNDELAILINSTTVYLKLTKDADEPQRLGEAPCSNAIDGAEGSCVYLTRCEAAKNITVDIYTSTYCVLDKYAGVCCPKGISTKTTNGLSSEAEDVIN